MHRFNDAGQPRSLNGGWCGVRALVIATGIEWKQAERHLKDYTAKGKAGNRSISKGIYKQDYDAALRALGFQWVKAPQFSGRKARAQDLSGVVIARQARHFVAVIDGVTQDTWDCSHKMVYGYWWRPETGGSVA